MKKKIFLNKIAKIFEKQRINENDTFIELGYDSLIGLDLATFNDENFPKLEIKYENIEKCNTINDLIKLYGNQIEEDGLVE